jgi:hypothetical protein
MAIYRHGTNLKKKTAADILPDFSYHPNDALAQMIVDAWVDPRFEELLKDKANAKSLLASRGFFLSDVAVVDKATYDADTYAQKSKGEIVLVLPPQPGKCPPGANLLDTARFLMACTPNGI